MDQDQLIARLRRELSDWSGKLTYRDDDTADNEVPDSDNAIADASAETGWTLPIDDPLKIRWFKERVKRHLLEKVRTGSAKRFQAQGYALQQPFTQLSELIDDMDEKFNIFLEERPDLFGNADMYRMFGSVITTGRVTDQLTGRDIGTTPRIYPDE